MALAGGRWFMSLSANTQRAGFPWLTTGRSIARRIARWSIALPNQGSVQPLATEALGEGLARPPAWQSRTPLNRCCRREGSTGGGVGQRLGISVHCRGICAAYLVSGERDV